MGSVRVAALLLVCALLGPSAGSLVCDWACAAKHDRASSDCHEHGGSGTGTLIESAHQCHDLVAATDSILTGICKAELRALAVAAALSDSLRPSALPLSTFQSSGPSHAPPPLLISLRI